MSGQPIGAVVVWLSGVLLPDVTVALGRALGGSERWFNWLALPAAAGLVENWQTGQIGDDAFWPALIERAGLALAPETARRDFAGRMQLNADALAVLAELPAGMQRWLLVDLPAAVRPPDLAPALAAFCTLELPAAGLARLTPDAFDLAAARAGLPLRECLLVDGNHRRAVQALRHGASVGLYVSPWRLRREFVLRRMLPVPLPSHVPGQSR